MANEVSLYSVTALKVAAITAISVRVTARVTPMLSLMIVCAVGAARLFFLSAFDELREIWTHPDHTDVDDWWHHPKPKGQNRTCRRER
jgi:hypothetical protein